MQVLIDPVCFLTCYPQLLYNFVYKVPTAGRDAGLQSPASSARRASCSRGT